MHIVSDETLLKYLGWDITFTLYTDASDKILGIVIIHNSKTIDFLKKIKQFA